MREHIQRRVKFVERLCRPNTVQWCDGSQEEEAQLIEKLERENKFIKLSSPERSYLHRSNPDDVSRTEDVTFICTEKPEDAGPTNNYMEPLAAAEKVRHVLKDAMHGRTMYVVPAIMGPLNSPYARIGFEITDSAYVALSIHRLYRVQSPDRLQNYQGEPFIGIHSLGTLSPAKRMIAHLPEENLVLSVNSGFGGNSILFKKCFSLRLASWQARRDMWLAEHMAVFGVQDPAGRITYFAAALPSGCGKTNLSMLANAVLPGYKVWTVSDDLCWMHIGDDGRLWAINPEAGFFAIIKDTNEKTNPRLMNAISQGDAVFTNIAITADSKPWWTGIGEETPSGLTDWQGRQWHENIGPVSHPNARVTLRAKNCENISLLMDYPYGVPISGIILGGRRSDTMPLALEARDWRHGVFLGASMMSETTAATTGKVGVLRHDPFAMMPFCGYNMADYFAHWLAMGERLKNPPVIFHVNWFLKSLNNQFLWRGYGENIRVLDWMIRRIRKEIGAHETACGLMPYPNDALYDGDRDQRIIHALRKTDRELWKVQLARIRVFFEKFGDRMPQSLWQELENLERALRRTTVYF